MKNSGSVVFVLLKGVGRWGREGFFFLVFSFYCVFLCDFLFNMVDEGERNWFVVEFFGVIDVDVEWV